MNTRPPLPPFTRESAIEKVRLAEDGWNSRDPAKVALAYEWHDDSGNWFRSYGNENWEFEPDGLMKRRFACVNDMPIKASERLFHWPLGRRPDDHPSLSDLGL
jgi:nuclear transport factor 2 (NTF2) superfamily protein